MSYYEVYGIRKLKKGGIFIKKKNRGKFTEWCKRQGYNSVTSECISKGKSSDNSNIRKQATFAKNARGWK